MIAAILLAIAAPDFPLHVEDFARPEDRDASPAFERLLASEACASGCPIELGWRKYTLSRSIILCRPIYMWGADAGRDDFARTVLEVSTPTTAIQARDTAYCEARGLGSGARGFHLRGFLLAERPQKTVTPRVRFGLWAEAYGTIERVDTRGFLVGLYFDAGARRALSSDGNGSTVLGARTKGSDHAGLLVTGPDANASTFLAVFTKGACGRSAGLVSDWGECGGQVDASFLGNTHVGPHTSAARDEAGMRPGYIVRGANNRSILIGAYAEEDQLQGSLAAGSMAFGGKSHWRGGLWASARQLANVTLLAPTIKPVGVGALNEAVLLRLEVSPAEWWHLAYDPRTTSAHRGWTRLLWKGASSAEIGAMKGAVDR